MMNLKNTMSAGIFSLSFLVHGTQVNDVLPLALNANEQLKQLEVTYSNLEQPERYIFLSTVQELIKANKSLEDACARVDTPEMIFLRTHIDEIAQELSTQKHNKEDRRIAVWLEELRPLLIAWVNNFPRSSVRNMQDVLATEATKTAVNDINAWWKKGKKLIIKRKYKHTKAAGETVCTWTEKIVGEKYNYLTQHAQEIIIDGNSSHVTGRFISSFNKAELTQQIHAFFDRLPAQEISEEYHKQECAQADLFLTALTAILKDEALLADIQQSIDQKQSKNVLHAVVDFVNGSKINTLSPAQVVAVKNTLNRF